MEGTFEVPLKLENQQVHKLNAMLHNGEIRNLALQRDTESDEGGRNEKDDTSMTARSLSGGDSYSSIFCACENGDLKALQEFFRNGIRTFAGISKIDVDKQDSDGFTPLMIAAACGRRACVDLLLRKKANVALKTKDQQVLAIHLAARAGSVEIVQKLLRIDPSLLNVKTKNGDTPVVYACMGAHLKVVKTLINAGADLNMKAQDGGTVLMIVATLEDSENDDWAHDDEIRSTIMEAILVARPDLVNATDSDGTTAMHLAAGFGISRCVETLLKYGADITLRDADGNTPLQLLMDMRHKNAPSFANPIGRASAEEILAKEWQRLEERSAKQILEIFGVNDEEDVGETLGSLKSTGNRRATKKKGRRGGRRKGRRGKKARAKKQETAQARRVGIACDGCYGPNDKHVREIVGTRYKCTVCEDFDLCENCFLNSLTDSKDVSTSKHGPGHAFVRLRMPTSRDDAVMPDPIVEETALADSKKKVKHRESIGDGVSDDHDEATSFRDDLKTKMSETCDDVTSERTEVDDVGSEPREAGSSDDDDDDDDSDRVEDDPPLLRTLLSSESGRDIGVEVRASSQLLSPESLTTEAGDKNAKSEDAGEWITVLKGGHYAKNSSTRERERPTIATTASPVHRVVSVSDAEKLSPCNEIFVSLTESRSEPPHRGSSFHRSVGVAAAKYSRGPPNDRSTGFTLSRRRPNESLPPAKAHCATARYSPLSPWPQRRSSVPIAGDLFRFKGLKNIYAGRHRPQSLLTRPPGFDDRTERTSLRWMHRLHPLASVLSLETEHYMSRRLNELSASQLDVLEDMHMNAVRMIREARLNLARSNEREKMISQLRLAKEKSACLSSLRDIP